MKARPSPSKRIAASFSAVFWKLRDDVMGDDGSRRRERQVM